MREQEKRTDSLATIAIPDFIVDVLEDASLLASKFAQDEINLAHIASAIQVMSTCLKKGGKILSCGNGGSMCDSMHFAEELSARYIKNRRPLSAMAISDAGYLSCTANDFGHDQIFSRFVEGMGRSGDVLLAISTSGNSPNVLQAATMAKEKGMEVVALLGKGGGKLKALCDIPILIDSLRTERIQELHIKVIHILVEGIERELFPELYPSQEINQ
ncbi:MAG: SIS domain-containing protein [Oligoflexia bacterium]|nr:SIS domain-containing protein [Oligoflexia bacterium]